jgi:hypothetical protein
VKNTWGLKLDEISVTGRETFKVPDLMDKIVPAGITEGKTTPIFPNIVDENVFLSTESETDSARHARLTDLAFHFSRSDKDCPPSWSDFNQSISTADPDLTNVGYMPKIQAPAHDIDTLNTVVQRCMHVSEKLQQK